MTATMTVVGLDVHARSTHAAAIDVVAGELRRARLGAGAEPVVEWLRELLVHGRVYPEPSTWTQRQRQWLARQRFAEPATELAYLDALAAVDGLVARTSRCH